MCKNTEPCIVGLDKRNNRFVRHLELSSLPVVQGHAGYSIPCFQWYGDLDAGRPHTQ